MSSIHYYIFADDESCVLQAVCGPDARCEPLPNFNFTCGKYFHIVQIFSVDLY
jgi:hypothetical protein